MKKRDFKHTRFEYVLLYTIPFHVNQQLLNLSLSQSFKQAEISLQQLIITM